MEPINNEPDDRVFRKHLLPDETIEWIGRPVLPPELSQPMYRYAPGAAAMMLMADAAMAALVYNFTGQFYIAGIAFLGLIVLELPRLTRKPMADAHYAVTNKRVLLTGDLFTPRKRVDSMDLADVTPVLGQVDPQGLGSIILNRPDLAPEGTAPDYKRMLGGGYPRMLMNVPNAQEVLDTIERTKRSL